MNAKRILVPIAFLHILTLCAWLVACGGKDISEGTVTETVTETAAETSRMSETEHGTVDGSTAEPNTEPTTEVFETEPQPEPIDRSEYPPEQAGAKTDTVLYAADFGVVGDGVTDDGPAIDRAVEEAVSRQATLRFEAGKTYYIGSTGRNASAFSSPFAMNGADGVTVDGGGSVFRFGVGINYIVLTSGADIRFCNMKFDLTVSPYLVGTVTAVEGTTVTFATDSEPYADSWNYGGSGFSIKYNEGTQNRPHMMIEQMRRVGEREIEVRYTANTHPHAVGDVVFLPNPGIGHVQSEIIYVSDNTGCLVFENIEVWASPSFIANIRSNDAEIYFENVDFIPGEENHRAIQMVSWRDGYHVKDNRRPIHWNECDVGVLFDDVFNVSNTLGCVTAVRNGNRFTVANYEFYERGSYVAFDCREGDMVDLFSAAGEYAGAATVRRVLSNPNGTVDIVLDYGVEMTEVEKGWLVGNRDTCAPGSTITDSRFEGTFRFRRDICIRNCDFRMLAIWIHEDGSVEGPLPGNIDFVNCNFYGGSIDIGAEGKAVRNAIRDIGFWDCSFEDGAEIARGRGCKITKQTEWSENELFTVLNRRMTTVPTVISPSELDLTNTVIYDWTNTFMPIEGGAVTTVSALTDVAVRDLLTTAAGFADRTLVLTGGENGTRYILGGLTSEFLPDFHQNDCSYVLSMSYYTASETSVGTAGFLRGDVATVLAEGLFSGADGVSSITLLYEAKQGNTALYIDIPAGAVVYVGRLNLTATSAKNPSEDQLYEGHTFVWSDAVTIGQAGEALNYEKIADAAVRDAILNAEEGFTSGRVLHIRGELGDFTGFTDAGYYMPGKTYHLSLHAYIASSMVPRDGTKIYLLAMDDTAGNRVLAEGLFEGEGFVSLELDWTVGNTSEKSLRFYLSNTPEVYADLYIGDFTITMAKSVKPDVFLSRDDYHTLTAEELKEGYTFDFSEGNLADLGHESYTSVALLPEKVATLLRENGFGETVYYCDGGYSFGSLPNELTGGRHFRITMQVYDVTGNLSTTLPRGAFVLLCMQGGVQNAAEVSYQVTPSEADSHLLTLTFDVQTSVGTDDLLFYRLTTVEYLIGSVTIQQLS